MTPLRTTQLSSRNSTVIPLFWFVQASEEQRDITELALDQIVDRIIQKNAALRKKKVAGIPWLRNYPPSAADVVATARGFDMGEGHVLGIDALCLEDGNLLVLHSVNKKEPEIGRATREDAVGALLNEHLHRYTLAEALDGRPWTELHVPRIPEPTVEEKDTEWVLPSHIPFHTRLQEDKVILFSLIKLTDEEISVLKQNMDGGTNEVTIYNWPHETPASQAETYNIFQCVKPEAPVAGG
ncbi:hypothetical protein EKO04_008957 [Ascochyta lentis]|uniref:Uncharacterized protein n=1 Tax=Ascochyta lentis TaxID=205686 RepID=A0A8H7IYP1_9PLEO|nr:hypothetical protein EKO04_008957 [Ascochyta lentis]